MNDEVYKGLFESSPAGLLLCGADGGIYLSNAAAASKLLAHRGIPPGASLLDYIAPEDRESVQTLLADTAEGACADVTCLAALENAAPGKRTLQITAKSMGSGGKGNVAPRIILALNDMSKDYREYRSLRISEEKYRAMMNFCGDAILVFDFGGFLLEANIKALSLFGYSHKAFLGKHLDDLYPPEQYPQYKKIFEEISHNGSAGVSDIDIVTKTGGRIPVDLTGSVVEYSGKSFIQMILRDISQKKKAEKELRESEERYRKLVELAPDSICVHIGGKIVFMNETGLRMAGFSSLEEAVGYDALELVYSEDRKLVMERIQMLQAGTEKLEPIRERLINVNGELYYAESNSVTLDYNGEKAMLVYTRDISRQVQADRALRDSEETTRALINATPDWILLLDESGTVLAANGGFASAYDLPLEKIIGECVWTILPKGVVALRKKKVNEVFTEKKPLKFTDEENGKIIDSTLYPIRNSEGDVDRVAVYARDITEHINAEADKNRLLTELNQIFSISSVGLCVIGNDCTIFRTNSAYMRMLGLEGNIEGRGCKEVMDIKYCDAMKCMLKHSAPLSRMGEYEIVLPRDDMDRNLLVSETPFYGLKGERIGILRSITDITAIRRLEKELINISDHERRLIGQDLHDGIGQVLTGIAFMLEKLEKRMKKNRYPESSILEEIGMLNNDAIDKVKSIIKGLNPVLNDRSSLGPALRQLADETCKFFQVKVNMHFSYPLEELEIGEATQIYYIIREAIHNAIKHGGAGRIDVDISGDMENGYSISIIDDEWKKCAMKINGSGMGLNIMKYRAEMTGSDFSCGPFGDGFRVFLKKRASGNIIFQN